MLVMERRIPIDNLSLIHPILYLSFLAAGLAASMAIITALCSDRFRRKSSPTPPSDPIEIGTDLDAPTSMPDVEGTVENENNDPMELPLPPAMQHPKDPLPSNNMKRMASERITPFNLSIKMPRSFSVAMHHEQKEDKIKGKLKPEDSVWMKTIILGEKCVPDQDDDPVIYEGKGKKISAYHTKRYSCVSISRQNSFTDTDTLSSSIHQPKTQDQIINNT